MSNTVEYTVRSAKGFYFDPPVQSILLDHPPTPRLALDIHGTEYVVDKVEVCVVVDKETKVGSVYRHVIYIRPPHGGERML